MNHSFTYIILGIVVALNMLVWQDIMVKAINPKAVNQVTLTQPLTPGTWVTYANGYKITTTVVKEGCPGE